MEPGRLGGSGSGWWILREAFEGRGYARDAEVAARGHAFETLRWPAVFSVIEPGDARSIALARRLGAVEDRLAGTPDGTPVIVFRHPGPDDQARPVSRAGEMS